jgi:two-component system, OmpR family, phosphate regulon sensor histidine kinase PhoR
MDNRDGIAGPPPRRVNRLALRAALVAAPAAGAAVFAVLASGAEGWVVAAVAAAAGGGAAYGVVRWILEQRLALALATLRMARERRFESPERFLRERPRDELDELLREVDQTGRVMQQEIERLETLESYRRDFLGNISHELKTPIFVIGGFAEQLLDGALEDPRVNRRFVEKIGRNAERLGHLARDLLAISRIETGEMRMQHAPFPLKALAQEVVESLEPVAEAQRVRLVEAVPPDVPEALGDRELLRQVITNLVDNGIKYNREGGRVEVTARLLPAGERRVVRVVVADDGIGIPAQALPRITERFYRVDRSRSRQQGGTGLGLAIVKHVIEAHGSRLQIESRPGQGSAFSFDLPVAETDAT